MKPTSTHSRLVAKRSRMAESRPAISGNFSNTRPQRSSLVLWTVLQTEDMFAFGIGLQLQAPEVDLEPDQAILRFLDHDLLRGRTAGTIAMGPGFGAEELDAGVPVGDLQAGIDLLGEDSGPGRRLTATARDAAAEEELDALRSAEVDVILDHLLEQLAAVERAVEDLGATDLELKQGELVGVTRTAILTSEGAGQPVEPALEEALAEALQGWSSTSAMPLSSGSR